MGKKNDRLNRLIGILKIRGAVSIRELAQTLEVSEMTIRRDMKLLQQNKVVENVDGVMVYNPAHTLVETDKEYSLALEEERRNAEKAAIGAFAASLVAQDDMIIIDTGTTTVHIARNLPTNLHLSVLCYNINILMELRRKPNIQPLFADASGTEKCRFRATSSPAQMRSQGKQVLPERSDADHSKNKLSGFR